MIPSRLDRYDSTECVSAVVWIGLLRAERFEAREKKPSPKTGIGHRSQKKCSQLSATILDLKLG